MPKKPTYEINFQTYLFLRSLMREEPERFKEELERAIARNYPVNFLPRSNEYAYSPLLMTAFEIEEYDTGDELSLLLLEAGADVNIIDPLQNSALISAIRNQCSIRVIDTIFRKTTNINQTNAMGHTALGTLCYTFIKMSMLSYDPDAVRYRSALLMLIRKLLDAGADLEIDTRWEKYNNARKTENVSTAKSELTTFLQIYSERRRSMKNSPEDVYDYEL